MFMITNSKITPADVRRLNLKTWSERNTIPPKEKSYFSQLITGVASFGEKAARRLEDQYGMGNGFLDLPIQTAISQVKSKDPLGDLLSSDPGKGIEEILLNCFRGCKDEDRDLLLSIANKLYQRVRPDDRLADPYGRRKSDASKTSIRKKDKSNK